MKLLCLTFWMLGFSLEVAILICATLFALLIGHAKIICPMWRESMDSRLADLDEILK